MPSRIACNLCLAAAFWMTAFPALAQNNGAVPQPDTLPGGASSLQENFGDWTVLCALPGGRKTCSLSQSQLDTQSRQRIVAIELAPGGEGVVGGALAMPFGLVLAEGVSLKVDGSALGGQRAFRTCLPAGCIVPLSLAAGDVEQLASGETLELGAVAAENNQPVTLSISLNGFSAALQRLRSLM